MKLYSCCREKEMQVSGPTLSSLAKFYIEIEQFCCSLSAAKACIWNIRPDNKILLHGKICISSPEVLRTSKFLQGRDLDEF